MRLVLRPFLFAAFVLAVVGAPRAAGAVVRSQSDYPYEQVWNAAVRLVRVDLGFEVLERDQEGGFVLFKYRGDSGTFNASLEIVRAASNGKVGVVIQIPEMPRYTELWLLDRLNRKLRDDFGAPPLRPTRRDGAARGEGRNGSERGRSGERRDGDRRDGDRGNTRGRGGSSSSDRRSSSRSR